MLQPAAPRHRTSKCRALKRRNASCRVARSAQAPDQASPLSVRRTSDGLLPANSVDSLLGLAAAAYSTTRPLEAAQAAEPVE